MAIFGVLISLALPAFNDWMLNMRLRNQADFVLSGIQKARGEALRRNRFVRFQLVSAAADGTLDSGCDVADVGNRWIVSHGNPKGKCDLAQSQDLPADNNVNSDDPILLIRGVREGNDTDLQTIMVLTQVSDGSVVAAPASGGGHALCFAPSGQLTRYDTTSRECTASLNPGTTFMARSIIDFAPTSLDLCAPTGPARCLRINVGTSGETRLCDTTLPQLASRTVAAATVRQRDIRGCSCDPSVTITTSPDYCRD
jgi:Tfp pilus assembly protein FimT